MQYNVTTINYEKPLMTNQNFNKYVCRQKSKLNWRQGQLQIRLGMLQKHTYIVTVSLDKKIYNQSVNFVRSHLS